MNLLLKLKPSSSLKGSDSKPMSTISSKTPQQVQAVRTGLAAEHGLVWGLGFRVWG